MDFVRFLAGDMAHLDRLEQVWSQPWHPRGQGWGPQVMGISTVGFISGVLVGNSWRSVFTVICFLCFFGAFSDQVWAWPFFLGRTWRFVKETGSKPWMLGTVVPASNKHLATRSGTFNTTLWTHPFEAANMLHDFVAYNQCSGWVYKRQASTIYACIFTVVPSIIWMHYHRWLILPTYILQFYDSMWLSIRICMIIDDGVTEKLPADCPDCKAWDNQ